MANYNLLQLRAGVHPDQPQDPQLLQAAMRGTQRALVQNVARAQRYTKGQYILLLVGIGFFLIWHILGIVERTFPRHP